MKKAICMILSIVMVLMATNALAAISATWSAGTLIVSTTDTEGMNMIFIDGAETGKFVGDTSPSQSFSVPEDGKTHTVTTVPYWGATGGSASFVAGEAAVEPSDPSDPTDPTDPIEPGEDWDEGVVTKEATCEEAGVKTYTDKNDPTKTKTEEIPALGHKAEKDEIVATIDTGYADGINRKRVGSFVSIKGKKYPIIGEVGMGMCEILADETVKKYDKVTVFGSEIPIRSITRHVMTTMYELMTNLDSSIPRIYED